MKIENLVKWIKSILDDFDFEDLEVYEGDVKFHRISNLELERVYNVYELEYESEFFIIKKCQSEYEVDVSSVIGSQSCRVALPVLGKFKDSKNKDVLLTSKGDRIALYNQEEVNLAAEALANLHSLNIENTFDILKTLNLNIEQTIDLLSKEYHEETVDAARALLLRLSNQPKRILHGDAVPLNIVSFRNNVVWIDWELACVGPYAIDMGRFLGDYNRDTLWISTNLRANALKCYYGKISQFNEGLSIVDFYAHLDDAITYNYLRIVRAYLNNSWEKNSWFFENETRLLSRL